MVVDRQWPFLQALRLETSADGAGHRQAGQEAGRWSDAIDYLVAAGYGSVADIGKMTRRQILQQLDAVERRHRRERAERVIDVNFAFAGGQDAERHLQKLLK
ncbi:TPA: hypothetical protein ACKROA_002696 [Pseudomonas aeruginosa]